MSRYIPDRGDTLPERIRNWVESQFAPQHWDAVEQDLIDVATGTRKGNSFEVDALARIFPEVDVRGNLTR